MELLSSKHVTEDGMFIEGGDTVIELDGLVKSVLVEWRQVLDQADHQVVTQISRRAISRLYRKTVLGGIVARWKCPVTSEEYFGLHAVCCNSLGTKIVQ